MSSTKGSFTGYLRQPTQHRVLQDVGDTLLEFCSVRMQCHVSMVPRSRIARWKAASFMGRA